MPYDINTLSNKLITNFVGPAAPAMEHELAFFEGLYTALSLGEQFQRIWDAMKALWVRSLHRVNKIALRKGQVRVHHSNFLPRAYGSKQS